MIFKNPKIKKVISGLLILTTLTPAIAFMSVPKQADAFLGFGDVVLDPANLVKNAFTAIKSGVTALAASKNILAQIANEILKSIAKRALTEITKSTVNWVNTGNFSTPLFVQNPQSFFKDITTSQIKDLISIVGYDPNRFPFGKQQALNIIAGYKSQLDTNAAYSLSSVTNDPTLLYNFRTNFSVGGWNGFILNTQYPQNNFIGSQMQINNQLALNLQGTVQAPAQKINTLLQQGAGFLSPQKCVGPNADAYNKVMANQFQRPTWKTPASIEKDYPDPKNYSNFDDPAYVAALQKYNDEAIAAKADWTSRNVCQGSLQTTTPGSVVANSIMTSITSGPKLTELQAALGGSLSAVFDAILNKFLGSGLSALATKINPPPPTDNFSYNGQTLGGPASGINGNTGDVFSTPDVVVDLTKFTTDVQSGIAMTQQELNLMDNSDSTNPGVLQYMENFWPEARALDLCVPGPNYGWEQRLDDEVERNVQVLQANQNNPPPKGVLSISQDAKNLQYAASFLKDWIKNEMILPVSTPGGLGLPSSSLFLDTISGLGNFTQDASTLLSSRQDKRGTMARLIAIEGGIRSVTAQKPTGADSSWPPDGSPQRQILNDYKKQYDAIFPSISNTTTVEDTKAARDTARDQFITAGTQVRECNTERVAMGWTAAPSGTIAQLTDFWGKTSSGGIDSFLSLSKIPNKIVKVYIRTLSIGPFNIPGVPTFGPLSGPGQFTAPNQNVSNPVAPYTVTGKEKEQFCDLPIAGGYSHYILAANDTLGFINGADPTENGQNVLYPSIPLVNAGPLLGDRWTRLSCDIIYQSNPLDYKGDLPGPTTVLDVNKLPENDIPLVPVTTSTSDPLGTCTTNGTTTQTTLSNCTSPGVWTAPATNTGTPPPGNTGGTPPPACGAAGQPACG